VTILKLLSNIKTFLTEHVASKDFTLRLSQLASVWDKGLDLMGTGSKGRPTNAYAQVGWVWLCVNLIIETCKSIPLLISNADDEVVESGPLYDFIYNKKFSTLMQETIGFYVLFREVYWIMDGNGKLSPESIRVAGPNTCEPVYERGELAGYRLHLIGGKTTVLLIDDVYVIKNFNPADPDRGVGPLTAGAMAISTTYQADQYNESTLANGARISVVLQVPKGTGLTDAEKQKLLGQFSARQSGAKNAGKAFLAEGIDDIKTLSQTMADLQMVDLSRFTAANICAMFGVPPEIVGLNSEAQYAHGPATQRFILYCVGPLLDTISDGIDEGILTRFRFKASSATVAAFGKSNRIACGRSPLKSRTHYRQIKTKAVKQGQAFFAWFDIDSHAAIQEMMRDRIDKLMLLVDKGIPINQVIDANDLPYDTTMIPWGDDHLVPMGMVTARSVVDGTADTIGDVLPQVEEEENPKSEERNPKQIQNSNEKNNETVDKDAAMRVWLRYVASFLPIEKQYAERVRLYFRQQRKELVDKLAAALNGRDAKSCDCTKDTEQVIARVVFDLQVENKKLRVINRIFFERASDLGIAQAVNEVTGLKGDELKDEVRRIKLSPAVRNSLAVSSEKVSKVNKTTREAIARNLRQGLESGEGLPQLTDRIEGVLDTSRGRAGNIARTQVSGAVSAGRHAGMVEAGVEKKAWLTAGDDVVRDTHREAGIKYKAGIPIDEAFVVGGEELMYPGDPSGSPAEIINCRCVQLARIASGKTLDIASVNFLRYDEIKTLLNEV
jgi:HK97 family phage portal protein